MDERIKKLAYNLVNYSVKVKEGEKVYVHYIGNDTTDLARAVIKEVYKAKGIPFAHFTDNRVLREILLECSEEQLKIMSEIDCMEMDKMDCYIGIRGTDNIAELSDVPADKMNMYETLYGTPVHSDRRVAHTKWVVLRYPNPAMAQLSNMSLEAFEDYYFNVCNLDYSKMDKAMDSLQKLMNKTDKVRLTGPGTDIDEGARYVGEFAIGVNPYITSPMKDILFDEKIMGSIHFTPGCCYDDAPNGNKSSIHWDLVFIQTKEYGGGEIYFDDVLIRKDGVFVPTELECLNPENLK